MHTRSMWILLLVHESVAIPSAPKLIICVSLWEKGSLERSCTCGIKQPHSIVVVQYGLNVCLVLSRMRNEELTCVHESQVGEGGWECVVLDGEVWSCHSPGVEAGGLEMEWMFPIPKSEGLSFVCKMVD
jgi:hypothetical protein